MKTPPRQEFVIGGYTHGTVTFDGLIQTPGQLIYVARTRNGFTPVTRASPKKFTDSRSVSARLRTCRKRRAVVGAKG